MICGMGQKLTDCASPALGAPLQHLATLPLQHPRHDLRRGRPSRARAIHQDVVPGRDTPGLPGPRTIHHATHPAPPDDIGAQHARLYGGMKGTPREIDTTLEATRGAD